jgi:hypothetical protein
VAEAEATAHRTARHEDAYVEDPREAAGAEPDGARESAEEPESLMPKSQTRQFKAFVVEVDGQEYQVQLHRPGRPRIYRSQKDGSRRKVDPDDPVIAKIPAAMRERVAEDKRMRAHRRSWAYRMSRAIGRFLGRLWAPVRKVLFYRVW